MAPPIHEYLPMELFLKVLIYSIFSACSRDGRQGLPGRQSEPSLRAAIVFSSVCKEWREITTSIPALWSNIEFRNFNSSDRYEAIGCMCSVLRRSSGQFRRVSLDFSSLKDTPNTQAGNTICATLSSILQYALPSTLSPWGELSIVVTRRHHMEHISDFFLRTASNSIPDKLSAITTLRLRLEHDSHSATGSAGRLDNIIPSSASLPYFNTLNFKNLMRVYLSDIRIIVFPSNLHQTSQSSNKMFELYLEQWTSQIDVMTLMPARLTTQADISELRMPAYHLTTDSPMNLINSSLRSATALTLVFPHQSSTGPEVPSPTSCHLCVKSTHSLDQTLSDSLSNFTANFNIHDVARIFLWDNIPDLRYIELINITPHIWLTLLALLKPIAPDLLFINSFPSALPRRLSWEYLIIRFAPNVTRASPLATPSTASAVTPHLETANEEEVALMQMISEGLGLNFDFQEELEKVQCAADLGILMKQCLSILNEEMLPNLKVFSCHDPNGRHWRSQTIWRRKL